MPTARAGSVRAELHIPLSPLSCKRGLEGANGVSVGGIWFELFRYGLEYPIQHP